MPVPQEFSHLAECFYSRSDLEYASAEEWVHATVRDTMSDKQRAVVRRYLAELLSGPASDADLMKIWNGLESDYWIEEPRGARALFRAIAAALGD